MADKIFKAGLIPRIESMPKPSTHARAKLVYNILKGLAVMSKQKRIDALQEIKDTNKLLHGIVDQCWRSLTEEQIQFYKGPRPHFYADGTLAIYHPQLDNPLMQIVLKVVDPVDADRFGQRKPKLILPKSAGGVL